MRKVVEGKNSKRQYQEETKRETRLNKELIFMWVTLDSTFVNHFPSVTV